VNEAASDNSQLESPSATDVLLSLTLLLLLLLPFSPRLLLLLLGRECAAGLASRTACVGG